MSGRDDAVDAIATVREVVTRTARGAGRGAMTSGRWLAEALIDIAPRVPIRDRTALDAQFPGLTDAAMADELVNGATRASAAVGALAGALASAEELAPPAWLALPLELVVETLAVAALEMKLVAELHAALGRPLPAAGADRTWAIVRSWAEQRGISALGVLGGAGVADSLGRGARTEVVRLVRRRLVRRLGRNLTTLAPLLIGAVAGAEVNRRATRRLGASIVADLTGSGRRS
jgi:hypothetical protein